MDDKELGVEWPDHLVGLSLGKAYPKLRVKVMLSRNLAQTFWTFKIRSLVIVLPSAMNSQDCLGTSFQLQQPLEWAVGCVRSDEEWAHDLHGVPMVSHGPCGEHGRDLVGKRLAAWTCERPFNGMVRRDFRHCPRGCDLTNPSQQVPCPTGNRFSGMGS